MVTEPNKANLLLVTQRLSDFVEMRRAALGLKKYGYKITVMFCGVGQKQYDNEVIAAINKSIAAKEVDAKILKPTYLPICYAKPKPGKLSKLKTALLKCTDPITNKKNEALEKISQAKQKKKDHISSWKNFGFKSKLRFVRKLRIKPQTNMIKNTIGRAGIKLLIRIIQDIRLLSYGLLFIFYWLYNKISAAISLCYQKIKHTIKMYFDRPLAYIKKINFVQLTIPPLLYIAHYKLFKKLLKENQIQVILLPEDIVGYVSPLLIKAGHQYQIPSIILPYTIANQSEAFQSLKNNHAFAVNGKINRLIAHFNKSWIMSDEQHKVMRLPAGHVLGHLITRCSPPDPWMMNSGFANIIAAENQRMVEYYQASGIPASKLKITGSCYDDHLAHYHLNKDQEKRTLYEELGIENDKPILLIGGFPNQLVGNPPGFDFNSIEEAVNFIVDSLEPFRNSHQIMCRPHPNFQELGSLFSAKGILTCNIDTARLVALSDIYIAFASATIRWAIACGIPCINYDIFYYNFSDYKDVSGVLNALSKEEFKAATKTLSTPFHQERLRNVLELEKNYWGNMDKQSTWRIHQLIQDFLCLKKVPRTAS